MTILPIVERELRVASRRSFTYTLRLLIALCAIVVGGVMFLFCIGQSTTQFGMFIFSALAILALLYCLFAGRVTTADCLSEEKREGTLGLLFLTDLKGYDVVLGKLAATSVHGLYGMLAIFPVMAVPMLMGGVSNNQLWSMMLVLLVAFFYSLAIGMFASAISRDSRKAMGINFGILFFFAMFLPGLAGVMAANSATHLLHRHLLLASPLYPGFLCLFGSYLPPSAGLHRSDFWISIAIIHAMTWLLLGFSAWIAPRSWQDRAVGPGRSWKARLRGLWDNWNYGHPEKRPAFRKRLLDVNAYYWLASRAKLKTLHTWSVFIFLAGWWIWGRLHYGEVWLDVISEVTMAMIINATLKMWVALEAAQRLAEAQRVGSLELILSTPLTVRDILRGQFLALRRQFLRPLLLALALSPVLFAVARANMPHHDPAFNAWWWTMTAFLPFDMLALAWVAMARSLTAKNFNAAIINTVGLLVLLPWIVFGLMALATQLWYFLTTNGSESPGWHYYLFWWIGIGLWTNIFFALRARRVLYQVREIAMKRFSTTSSLHPETAPKTKPAKKEKNVSAPTVAAAPAPSTSSKPPIKPGWKKRLLYASLALVAITCCAAFYLRNTKPKYPPPVHIPLSLKRGQPRILPTVNGAFILLSNGWLCRWGAAMNGNSIAILPELVASNADWKVLCPTDSGYAGIRPDGTIWEADANGKLKQITEGNDWEEVEKISNWRTVALKKDGTIWAKGNMFGLVGRTAKQQRFETNFIQLTTNSQIAAIKLRGSGLLAIKRDGTLWAWGNVFINGPNMYMTSLADMTQVCAESNWTRFEPGWWTPVRNSFNEIWLPLYGTPKPDGPAIMSCELACSNALPDRSAMAFCGRMMQYEIRADGTLWEQSRDVLNRGWVATSEKPILWRQFGKRSDWVSLWSNQNTAFGLTSDGTIWTWGIDPSPGTSSDFLSKLRTLKIRLQFIMKGPKTPGMMMNGFAVPQFNLEPRPLMQLDGKE